MGKLTKSYQEHLDERLKDAHEVAEYLNAALEDEDGRVFLLALRDVASARGMSNIAESAQLNRENLYRMLSEQGNPTFASMLGLLRALGIDLQVRPHV